MGGVVYPSPHMVAGESIATVGLASGFSVGSEAGADEHPASTTATSAATANAAHRERVIGRVMAPS